MGDSLAYLIGIAVPLVFIIFIVFISHYRRCPPDKILVISGCLLGKNKYGQKNASKCVHGGAYFVWPVVQEAMFLDLTPFSIDIDLRNALTSQNMRANIHATCTVGISTEPDIMHCAAERLLGKSAHDIESLAAEIIYGHLRLIVARMAIEELNSQRDDFVKAIQQYVEVELNKIGLKLLNINIINITDEAGYLDALSMEAEARANTEATKRIAEYNREVLVANAERNFKVKAAVAEIKRIINELNIDDVTKALLTDDIETIAEAQNSTNL